MYIISEISREVVFKVLTEAGLQLYVIHEADDGHPKSVGSASPVNDAIRCIVINSTGTNLLSCIIIGGGFYTW